jgi:hypothetical protein
VNKGVERLVVKIIGIDCLDIMLDGCICIICVTTQAAQLEDDSEMTIVAGILSSIYEQALIVETVCQKATTVISSEQV